jgi:hypothetical protein
MAFLFTFITNSCLLSGMECLESGPGRQENYPHEKREGISSVYGTDSLTLRADRRRSGFLMRRSAEFFVAKVVKTFGPELFSPNLAPLSPSFFEDFSGCLLGDVDCWQSRQRATRFADSRTT